MTKQTNPLRKVLIFGIDGGTWRVLNPAMDRGYMPFLKSMVDTGLSGVLESTMPANTATAWGSFQTGMNPGKNGIYDFGSWDRKQRKKTIVNSLYLKETIWETASKNGYKIAAVNVPLTYPPKPVNGCIIAGIPLPSLGAEFVYPSDLKEELLNILPDYHPLHKRKIKKCIPIRRFEEIVQMLRADIENYARAALYLIDNRGPFDLFMVHFYTTDFVQHNMWHYVDISHPAHDEQKCQYIFENIYDILDVKLKEIYQRFHMSEQKQNEILTFVISDHGFQNINKRFHLGNWLCQNGYMMIKKPRLNKSVLARILVTIDFLKLRHLILSQKRRRTIGKKLNKSDLPDPIWHKTRAFTTGKTREGCIFLLEESESDRAKTGKEIIEKLGTLRDEVNNTPLVKRIWRKEELYRGEYLDLMPDLIVEPSDGYWFCGDYRKNVALLQERGAIRGITTDAVNQTGKHDKDGIIVATGDVVKKQSKFVAKITDIVPTISYYFGMPISSEIDGQVLQKIFVESFCKAQPVKKQAPVETIVQGDKEKVYSPADEVKVKQQLKNLGYL